MATHLFTLDARNLITHQVDVGGAVNPCLHTDSGAGTVELINHNGFNGFNSLQSLKIYRREKK